MPLGLFPETLNIYIESLMIFKDFKYLYIKTMWASLVAQWLRIRLPMQGTRVRALVREDPTCSRAAKTVRHTTEPVL